MAGADRKQSAAEPQRVAVVVLGDLGFSPRMQAHALALAQTGYSVDLIGFSGSPVRERVADHPAIQCHRLQYGAAQRGSVALSALGTLRKLSGLWRSLQRDIQPPAALLVQSPPAFPTLPVAAAFRARRDCKLIVDWHNLGHTILALQLGERHPLVTATAAIERRFAASADASFCVSRAMRDRLAADYALDAAHVLYDRPLHCESNAGPGDDGETRRHLGIDADRAVFVTATSWTRDEDLELLLDAATELDAALEADDRAASIVICGKGPGRAAFEEKMRRRSWQRVAVQTAFLPWSEYTSLLGSADLGICLHTSSSGVDLPMKIADMVGCALPVCAYDYGPVLGEMIGDTAPLFRTASELADHCLRVCREKEPFAPTTFSGDWQSHWDEIAAPVFRALIGPPAHPPAEHGD